MEKHIWQRSFWLGCIGLFLTVGFIAGVYGYIHYQQIERAVYYSAIRTIDRIPASIAHASRVRPTPAVAGATTVARFSKPLTVALYNGTDTNGITQQYEKKLEAMAAVKEYVTVVQRQYAAKRTYTGIRVIPIDYTRATDIQLFADLIGARIGSLPPGELKPAADVLVILGK